MALLPRTLAACLLTATLATASAQILAHPGMDSGNLNKDPWWQHAVLYQVDQQTQPEADSKYLANHLDSLHTLGIDALLLPMPSLPAAQSQPDPKLDDFDDLVRQASARGMRILLTLPVSDPAADLTGIARLWLNRGVAGFRVQTPPETAPSSNQFVLQSLSKISASTVGQRLLLTNVDLEAPETASAAPASAYRLPPHAANRRIGQASDAPPAQLQIANIKFLASPDGAALRPLLVKSLAQPNLLLNLSFGTMKSFPARHEASPAPSQTEQPSPVRPLAKVLATILLTLQPAALISSSANLTLEPNAAPIDTLPPSPPLSTPPTPVVPPGTYGAYIPYVTPAKPASPTPQPPVSLDPLTDWYRQLSELHHANAVLRTGTPILLDFDQQNALVWAVRPATSSPLTPPVVVACNLSASPVQLAVGPAIKKLNLRGTYMRTLLRSDKSIGPQDLDGVILPPHSVYIGELHR